MRGKTRSSLRHDTGEVGAGVRRRKVRIRALWIPTSDAKGAPIWPPGLRVARERRRGTISDPSAYLKLQGRTTGAGGVVAAQRRASAKDRLLFAALA